MFNSSSEGCVTVQISSALPRLRPVREKFEILPKKAKKATVLARSSANTKQTEKLAQDLKAVKSSSDQPFEAPALVQPNLCNSSEAGVAIQNALKSNSTWPRAKPVREKFIVLKKVKPNVKAPIRVCSAETSQLKKLDKDPLPKKSSSDQPFKAPASVQPDLESSNMNPMTFYPTMEQLDNFDDYVTFMESQGAIKAGIARIVPPKDWTARKAGYEPTEVNFRIKNPIQQNIAITKVSGAFTTIADRSIPPFTLPEYLRLATSPKYVTPGHSSYEELEELYWEQNQDASLPSPIYGADVQATLTDPDQQVFNLHKLPSLLAGMAEQIPGVNLPYLYIGMWKATFSWHVEDKDLYAVNYLHYGAPKTWYCVPPKFGYKLEQLAQKLFPEMTQTCFNLLRHKVLMIGPKLLHLNGIPVTKMVHEQGTIMVVFPHAYHSGFNHGFNMAESLNFALSRWVNYGKRFRECLCSNQKREVRFKMEQFVEKLQPDKLEIWKRGEDFALHPEDPEFMKKYLEDLEMRVDLGFITKEEFEKLKVDLSLKREIAPWFKKKFPLAYTDELELVVPDNISKDCLVDVNDNEIPSMDITVGDLSECYVKMKCLDEDVVSKHLKERKDYEAVIETQRLVVEAKAAKVQVGQGGKGCGFTGTDKEDLRAKKAQVKCSANRCHPFKACRKCSGCLEKNCEICVHCLDMPRNGGMCTLKQKCVRRICMNPVMTMCGSCKWQI